MRYSIRSDIVQASIDDEDLGAVIVHALSNDMVEFEVAGVRRIVSVRRVGVTVYRRQLARCLNPQRGAALP